MKKYTPKTQTVNSDREYYIIEDEGLFLKIDENVARGKNEANTLMTIDHPYIQKFVKSMVIGEKHHLYTEYENSKTLENLKPNEKDLTTIESQLFSAFSYMISKKIVHGDINVSNVLFDGSKILIIDWESAFKGDTIEDLFGPPTVTNHCGVINTIRMLRSNKKQYD